MQICTSPQTHNYTSIPPLGFLQAGWPSCSPTNSVKALKTKMMKFHKCLKVLFHRQQSVMGPKSFGLRLENYQWLTFKNCLKLGVPYGCCRVSEPLIRVIYMVRCKVLVIAVWNMPHHSGNSGAVLDHTAEVTFPPLSQPIRAGTWFNDPSGIPSWLGVPTQRRSPIQVLINRVTLWDPCLRSTGNSRPHAQFLQSLSHSAGHKLKLTPIGLGVHVTYHYQMINIGNSTAGIWQS